MNPDSISQFLMSFDDYQKLGQHPIPYSYSINKDDQFVYYFGANHSYDRSNEQYPQLRTLWNEFLQNVDPKNSVVFVEGGYRPVCESEESAITKYCEAGLITYLAHHADIQVFSPEPPEKLRFEMLLQKFTKDEIIYYGFALMAYQWNQVADKPDFYEYMEKSLKSDRQKSGWTDADFSIDHMINFEKEVLHHEFSPYDIEFFRSVVNPTKTTTRINELSRYEDSGVRDIYILEQIEKFWNEGKSIFIVYGCSHAIMHEQAVRKLI